MTEADWLSGASPNRMLYHLRGTASDRKLRLFACACARRVWHLLGDVRDERWVEVAERFADGENVDDEASRLSLGHRTPYSLLLSPAQLAAKSSLHVIGQIVRMDVMEARRINADVGLEEAMQKAIEAEERERVAQADLLRDIFGNPFRPAQVDPPWVGWGDWTIPKLAYEFYAERHISLPPTLAAALEAAGCANEDILTHLRGPGPHVQGCWVVDLLLGKE